MARSLLQGLGALRLGFARALRGVKSAYWQAEQRQEYSYDGQLHSIADRPRARLYSLFAPFSASNRNDKP